MWRTVPLETYEDPELRLRLLERIWEGSRNYAALLDALHIITDQPIACAWVPRAALEAFAHPERFERWRRRYERDLLDVVKADHFEDAREHGLSREEAAAYTADKLRSTQAQTTPAAVLKLLPRMRARERRAFGHYYLGAGTAQWEDQFRRSVKSPPGLILKYRHFAVRRGKVEMRAAEEADLRSARTRASQGDVSAKAYLTLFKRI